MSMWPWIHLRGKFIGYEVWGQAPDSVTITQFLFPLLKPPDHVKDIYDGQNYDLKTRVEIWTRIDAVPVDYGTFSHTFHLTMWFFQFITGVTFKWDYVMWCIISLLVCIGILTKLIIYRVPPDPVRWYCRGFGFLWQAFMLSFMLWTNNDFKVSHRNQFNAPWNMKFVTSLMNF